MVRMRSSLRIIHQSTTWSKGAKMPVGLIEDKMLSSAAKGYYVTMLTKPPGSLIDVDEALLNELLEAGWCSIEIATIRGKDEQVVLLNNEKGWSI